MWYSRVWYYDPPDSRGPRAPSLYGVGSGAGVYADFHKKKIGQQSGGWEPRRRFCPFCRYELKLGQKGVAAHWISLFVRTAFCMCGQTPTRPAKMGLACAPLSLHKERGKRSARGNPLGTPGNFDF